MKAITCKHLPPTDTKPRRLKVQAEGVPHLIFDSNGTTPRQAAERLCVKFGWPTDLIEGTLPNGDLVFVFSPYTKLIEAGEGLAGWAFSLQEKVGRRQVVYDNLKAARQRWDLAREDSK